MGRYRGGGRGSGALIQIVVYLVIHIIEAIIRAVANRSKTPKVIAHEHYKKRYDDERDYDSDDDDRAHKKRRKQEYAVSHSYKQPVSPDTSTELIPAKPSKWHIPFFVLAIPILAAGLVLSSEVVILASIGTFALGLAIMLMRKPAIPVAAPQKPTPAPVMDTVAELRRICEHLEDEALVTNVQEIIKYTQSIEQALVKYPNAKKGELVQEYNAQLLNFLNLYNEAEDLRLTGKASLSMMENTRTYAADLVQMMRNVLEQIYEANVETADVNIEVMRKDMRMRGLMDEEK